VNTIPLVTASEPGIAHVVNPFGNCSLETLLQFGLRPKSFWKKASERVRIPSGWVFERMDGALRVAYFGSGALNGR
jgi:hypothetical protein